MNDAFSYGFLAVLAGVFVYLAYQVATNGGLRGMLFGTKVLEQVGEVAAKRRGPMSVVLRVHRLEPTSDGVCVGLEFTTKSFASFQMTGASLSREQVKALTELLTRAAT